MNKLNGCQRRAIKEFEHSTGFEFMYIEDINADRMTFREAWLQNEKWLIDWVHEATNTINLDGCGMLKGI